MERLNGVLGVSEPGYLLATNIETDAIAVSVEPGNGVVPAGAVLYRKSGALYAPAATANIAANQNLVVLANELDTTTSETVAAAAKAYRKANFIKGKVTYLNSGDYAPITAAHEVVLRAQGLTLTPMHDYSAASVSEATNTATVSVTVTNDGNGTGSASPNSGTYGDVVTLTATPGSGYELDYWEVVSGGVTVGADNKFTIGDEAVTVKAHFKAST